MQISVFAICNLDNTPKILANATNLELKEGEYFTYQFKLYNLRNGVATFSIVALERGLSDMNITESGFFSATPTAQDVGEHKIAVIALKDNCADIGIFNLRVYSKPQVTGYTPNSNYFEIEQGGNVTFSIKATTESRNTQFRYTWIVDGIRKETNISKYNYNVGNRFGIYNMTVNITDLLNLSKFHTWKFNVTKKGKPPVLKENIPDVLLYNNTLSGAYDLSDFFIDPSNGTLKYSYVEIESSYKNLSRAEVLVNITKSGYVSYNPVNATLGYVFLKFFATNNQNSTTASNQVKISVVATFAPLARNSTQISFFCGDFTCNGQENCTSCPADCGKCEDAPYEGCLPVWTCESWGLCQPNGMKSRSCFDKSGCADNRTSPLIKVPCNYVDYCIDGVKNNNETGIDCGGTCNACQNCTDGIQNGLETGIDCGGTCNVCASCTNNIKDGNETDIDCGDGCSPCNGGKACKMNKDCDSLLCEYLVCSHPTCFDQIKNQDEAGIDCEGSCEAICNTCYDNITNGNEAGVDCGGGCIPCATCFDGIKNDGELLTDCGGDCKACSVKDFIFEYQEILLLITSFLIFLATVFLAYMAFLVSNPESASKVYNSKKLFATLLFIHNIFGIFRRIIRGKPYLSAEKYKEYDRQLINLISKKNYTNREYYELLIKIVSELAVINNPIGKGNAYDLLKASGLPNIMKIFIVGYTNKIEILAGSNFVTAEQKIDFENKLRFLLVQLSKP